MYAAGRQSNGAIRTARRTTAEPCRCSALCIGLACAARYVVYRGTAIFGGRLLTRPNWWGDDIILADERCFLPYRARAITHVDVLCLSSTCTGSNPVHSHPTTRRPVPVLSHFGLDRALACGQAAPPSSPL